MKVPVISRRSFGKLAMGLTSTLLLPGCVLPTCREKIDAPNNSKANPQEHFWKSYKSAFLKALPKGTILVVPHYPIAVKGQTPAEGMGHALIFAAQREDWGVFNALVKGLSYFKKANGVLRWRIGIDGTVRPGEEDLNAGSETEQNVAYALLVAYEKTGKNSYRDEALEFLGSMWQEFVITFQGRSIIMTADRTDNPYWPLKIDKNGDQMLVWNPSLDSPHKLRKFAKYDQAHNWNKVVNDWYALANRVFDVATADPKRFGIAGINPMPQWVWLAPQGKNGLEIKPFFPARDALGSKYSDEGDTIRIPIYAGMDASHPDGKGRKFLERFYSKIELNGPEDAVVRIQNQPQKNSMMAIAAYAVGLKAIGRDVAQFEQMLKIDKRGFTGDAAGQYYDQTICYYAYLLLNDKFPY
ncbi:glycosyl hydrolase family 8 [Candidatus Margulisiibacteriota bacterium]